MSRTKFKTLSLGKPDHGARTHAKWSSSSSERWLNCDACIQFTDKANALYGEPPPSEAAQEGTTAHECLEEVFKNPELRASSKYSPEMIEHARSCVEWVREITPPGAYIMIETKAPLDFIGEDMGGTLDIAIVEPFKSLHVVDYKFGKGHVVSPVHNTQLISYALSVAEAQHWNFFKYKGSIFQPRTASKVPYKTWEATPAKIESYVPKLKAARERSLAPNPKPTQGDWCFFCPGKRICPAFTEKALEKTRSAFDDGLYEIAKGSNSRKFEMVDPRLERLRSAFE